MNNFSLNQNWLKRFKWNHRIQELRLYILLQMVAIIYVISSADSESICAFKSHNRIYQTKLEIDLNAWISNKKKCSIKNHCQNKCISESLQMFSSNFWKFFQTHNKWLFFFIIIINNLIILAYARKTKNFFRDKYWLHCSIHQSMLRIIEFANNFFFVCFNFLFVLCSIMFG